MACIPAVTGAYCTSSACCSYQRTCPVAAQLCQPRTGPGGGVVHLCVGHAGAQWYDNGFVPRPDWVAYEVRGGGRVGGG